LSIRKARKAASDQKCAKRCICAIYDLVEY